MRTSPYVITEAVPPTRLVVRHLIYSGTAGAPTVALIDEGRRLMAAQKDVSSNDYLDLRPALFVGGLAYGGAVRVINAAEHDHDGTKLMKPNMVRGLLRDVIDSPRITGNTWYLFADPADAPVIEVAFLDGASEPAEDSSQRVGPLDMAQNVGRAPCAARPAAQPARLRRRRLGAHPGAP